MSAGPIHQDAGAEDSGAKEKSSEIAVSIRQKALGQLREFLSQVRRIRLYMLVLVTAVIWNVVADLVQLATPHRAGLVTWINVVSFLLGLIGLASGLLGCLSVRRIKADEAKTTDNYENFTDRDQLLVQGSLSSLYLDFHAPLAAMIVLIVVALPGVVSLVRSPPITTMEADKTEIVLATLRAEREAGVMLGVATRATSPPEGPEPPGRGPADVERARVSDLNKVKEELRKLSDEFSRFASSNLSRLKQVEVSIAQLKDLVTRSMLLNIELHRLILDGPPAHHAALSELQASYDRLVSIMTTLIEIQRRQ